MAARLKELFSDTLVYGISAVVARFVNYLLVPLHTDVFAPGEYVTVGLVYGAIALLNVLFSIGFESAYLKFAKEPARARDLLKTLQTALLGVSLVFGLLLLAAQPVLAPLLELPGTNGSVDALGALGAVGADGVHGAGSPIYGWMLLILIFDTLALVPFAEFRLRRRTGRFASLKLAHVGINVGLNLWMILSLGMGIEAVFLSNLAASGLIAVLAWGMTLSAFLGGRFRLDVLRECWAFGWPLIPAGIGHVINEMIDRFFLNAMTPGQVARLYGEGVTAADVAGIYNGAYKLAVFMLLFIQMFRLAWQPFFMRHSDAPDAPAVIARSFRFLNLAGAGLFLGVAFFLQEIASLRIPILDVRLLGAGYTAGLGVVPWLLLAYWLYGWYIHFSAGIYISGRTRSLGWIMMAGAVVTIAANAILVPLAGMGGAAGATLASYSVMAGLLYWQSVKAYPVPYPLLGGLLLMGGAVALWWGVDMWAIPVLVEALALAAASGLDGAVAPGLNADWVSVPVRVFSLLVFLAGAWRWASRSVHNESP